MRDHERWSKSLSESLDVSTINALMAEVITAWPFEGNPKDPNSYGGLYPLEWKRAVEAVGKATTDAFQESGDAVDQGNKVPTA